MSYELESYLSNPRYAEDPVKIGFAPLSAVAAGLFGMMFGSIFLSPMLGVLVLIVAVGLATYIEGALPRGFLFHWLYSKGILVITGVPAGDVKKFRD